MFEGVSLRWRSRPSLVDRLLASAPLEPPLATAPGVVRVGVVQMAYRQTGDPALWIEQCQALTLAARRAGAAVVVFPALAPLGLICAMGDGELVAALLTAPGEQTDLRPPAAYTRLYRPCYRLYHRTFSFLAHRYGLVIATGGLPAPRRPVLTPVADVFAADGRLRLHRVASAPGRSWRSPEWETVRAGEARLTAVAGDEASRPELATTLGVGAVDLVASMPLGGAGALDGSAGALAAAAGLHVTRSCLVGTPASMRGRSGIYAPPERTMTGTGVLAQAMSEDGEEVLVATLDMQALPHGDEPAAAVGEAADAADSVRVSVGRVAPLGRRAANRER